MATLDWSRCPDIESAPGKVSGAWALRGMRMPVQVIFGNLQAGMTMHGTTEQFPVTREQIESLMGFVTESLELEPRYA